MLAHVDLELVSAGLPGFGMDHFGLRQKPQVIRY